MKKTVPFVIIFFIILSVLLTLVIICFPQKCILEGRYVTSPGINLSNLKLTFSIFDKDMQQVKDYIVNLKDDGSFKVNIKERGEFYLMLTGTSFPKNISNNILFSNEMVPYFYKFEGGKVVRPDDLYISEFIKVLSPKEDAIYHDQNDVVFEWTSIPFTDFYTILIYKVKENEKNELMICTNKIESNKITFKDILNYELIKEKMDFNMMKKIKTYNMEYKPLEEGKFEVAIQAHKYIEGKKTYLFLSNTDPDKRYYFFIE